MYLWHNAHHLTRILVNQKILGKLSPSTGSTPPEITAQNHRGTINLTMDIMRVINKNSCKPRALFWRICLHQMDQLKHNTWKPSTTNIILAFVDILVLSKSVQSTANAYGRGTISVTMTYYPSCCVKDLLTYKSIHKHIRSNTFRVAPTRKWKLKIQIA